MVIITNAAPGRYHNNPDETARRFVTLPAVAGKREASVAFRSGDRGLIQAEEGSKGGAGLLHYTGRADNMVKIRGNRVELIQA